MSRFFSEIKVHDNKDAVERGIREAMASCGLDSIPVEMRATKGADRQVAFIGDTHVAYTIREKTAYGPGGKGLQQEGRVIAAMECLPDPPVRFQRVEHEQSVVIGGEAWLVQIREKVQGAVVDEKHDDFARMRADGRMNRTLADLGAFMAWLHAQPTGDIAPHLTEWSRPRFLSLGTAQIGQLLREGPLAGDADVMAVAREALARQDDIAREPAVLVHGDLIPRNYAIESGTGALTGVFDFEMMHAGDRHFDLVRLDRLSAEERETVMQSYEAAGGKPLDRSRPAHYEVMHTLFHAAACHKFSTEGADWEKIRGDILGAEKDFRAAAARPSSAPPQPAAPVP